MLAAIVDWYKRFGAAPRSYEWSLTTAEAMGLTTDRTARWEVEHPRWPHSSTVAKHFGSWSAGLAAAGLPAVVREFDMPVAERVAAARRLAADGSSTADIAWYFDVDRRTVRNYLAAGGCIGCATPLASPTAERCRSCASRESNASIWTADLIVRAIRDWHEETGMQPTQVMWGSRRSPTVKWRDEHPRWPSAQQVIWHCGSWSAAIQAAGFATLRATWTRDDIIDALQRDTAALGRPPTRTEWLHASTEHPAASTVRDLFGSWTDALAAADLPVMRRRWDRDSVAAALADHIRRTGTTPTGLGWRRNPPAAGPSYDTVMVHHGSWASAVAAARARLN